MKKINSILTGLLLTAILFLTQEATAQAPQKMSYQSVLRNSSNALLVNTLVGIKISVLQGSASGTALFVETQTATTNANGLVSIQIGMGTATTGTFAGINWATGPCFIKTETDPAGGTNYTITGTQEILSVPYAMYAVKSADDTAQTAAITALQGQIMRGNVTIGTNAGQIAQATNSVAIGNAAGRDTQGQTAVAMGNNAGNTSQGINSVAMGNNAGYTTQGINSVAIGNNAGQTTQATNSVAIGNSTGRITQGINSVAIGNNAGYTTQGINSVAIGKSAGLVNQGMNSIAIGNAAGFENQAANSIILNASGVDLNSTTNGLFIKPIRNAASPNVLSYDPTSGEVTHSTGATTLTIGQSYQGGIIFWLDATGQHGLIAATADQSTGIRWYGGTNTNTRARGDGIGAGLKNTSIIIANQGPVDGAAFAATVCNEYSVTVGGVTYGDWYLPSKYELNLLYLNSALVGGFTPNFYWSSTEYDNVLTWYQGFGAGGGNVNNKNITYYVRAIRAF
jgi:hypothetical protein